MSSASVENISSTYSLESVVIVFPENTRLKSALHNIDNKQKFNMKPEDIFIVISRVYTEGNSKCILILVIVAYATLSI